MLLHPTAFALMSYLYKSKRWEKVDWIDANPRLVEPMNAWFSGVDLPGEVAELGVTVGVLLAFLKNWRTTLVAAVRNPACATRRAL